MLPVLPALWAAASCLRHSESALRAGRLRASLPGAPAPQGPAQVSGTLLPTSPFGHHGAGQLPAGEEFAPLLGAASVEQPRAACPASGRISCQGPKDLTGKGLALAKSGLSLHPWAKGSKTKAAGWTPVTPSHCPASSPWPPLQGLFLAESCREPLPRTSCCSVTPALSYWQRAGRVSPPLSNLEACLSFGKKKNPNHSTVTAKQ